MIKPTLTSYLILQIEGKTSIERRKAFSCVQKGLLHKAGTDKYAIIRQIYAKYIINMINMSGRRQ